MASRLLAILDHRASLLRSVSHHEASIARACRPRFKFTVARVALIIAVRYARPDFADIVAIDLFAALQAERCPHGSSAIHQDEFHVASQCEAIDRVSRRKGRRWRAKVISAVRIISASLDLLGRNENILPVFPLPRIKRCVAPHLVRRLCTREGLERDSWGQLRWNGESSSLLASRQLLTELL
jgi:hypothetical protein